MPQLHQDMSLIFNGDVKVAKAKAAAESLFRKDTCMVWK